MRTSFVEVLVRPDDGIGLHGHDGNGNHERCFLKTCPGSRDLRAVDRVRDHPRPGIMDGVSATIDFGHPGDGGLGDRLLAAVLAGAKTATSSLAVEYLNGDPLPRVGQRLTLVDHTGTAHGTVETTGVRIIPLHEVGDDVARAEGEGFTDAADWRRDHQAFWYSLQDLIREESGDPQWVLREAEPVVVHWFRLVDRSSR